MPDFRFGSNSKVCSEYLSVFPGTNLPNKALRRKQAQIDGKRESVVIDKPHAKRVQRKQSPKAKRNRVRKEE